MNCRRQAARSSASTSVGLPLDSSRWGSRCHDTAAAVAGVGLLPAVGLGRSRRLQPRPRRSASMASCLSVLLDLGGLLVRVGRLVDWWSSATAHSRRGGGGSSLTNDSASASTTTRAHYTAPISGRPPNPRTRHQGTKLRRAVDRFGPTCDANPLFFQTPSEQVVGQLSPHLHIASAHIRLQHLSDRDRDRPPQPSRAQPQSARSPAKMSASEAPRGRTSRGPSFRRVR